MNNKYKIFNVNNSNPIECDINNLDNFNGIQMCSKFINNSPINYGNVINNGNNKGLNYEFNNLNFINELNNNEIYSNIYDCDKNNKCKTDKLYSLYYLNTLPKELNTYCKDLKLCNNFNNTDNYYLHQTCSGDDCNYKLYCDCTNK